MYTTFTTSTSTSPPPAAECTHRPTRYLGTFTDAGLYAKKQWILPTGLVNALKIVSPLWVLVFLVPVVYYLSMMKRRWFWPKLLVIVLAAIFCADLFSSFMHITFVDNAYSETEFKVDEDGYMIVPVLYGYSSCHHYFPSNWKDVDDSTTMLNIAFILLFFIPLIELLVASVDLKAFIYIWYLFMILVPVSHKYMHERHHGRYVPWYFECMYRCGLFLQSEKHVKHHENDVYDWGLLNGMSDPMLNMMIQFYCHVLGLCPIELMSENYKKYETDFQTDQVKMRFTGDIEGRIICKREGTKFVLVQGNH